MVFCMGHIDPVQGLRLFPALNFSSETFVIMSSSLPADVCKFCLSEDLDKLFSTIIIFVCTPSTISVTWSLRERNTELPCHCPLNENGGGGDMFGMMEVHS